MSSAAPAVSARGTVTRQGGRWFCSFSVEVERHDPAPGPAGVGGVDLGVTSLAVLSTGEVIANPRHLEVAQRELRRLQRLPGTEWTHVYSHFR
jgi:putative transposase